MNAYSFLCEQLVAAIRSIGAGPVVLHKPCFAGNEWPCLKEYLDSTFVSSVRKCNKNTNAAELFITRRFRRLMTAFKNSLCMDLVGALSFVHRLVNIPSSAGLVQTAP